jgi:hypothetical protein
MASAGSLSVSAEPEVNSELQRISAPSPFPLTVMRERYSCSGSGPVR